MVYKYVVFRLQCCTNISRFSEDYQGFLEGYDAAFIELMYTSAQ